MKVEVDLEIIKAAALHLDDYVRQCKCLRMNSFKYSAEYIRKILEEEINGKEVE